MTQRGATATELLSADDPPLPGTGYAVASADDTDGKEDQGE